MHISTFQNFNSKLRTSLISSITKGISWTLNQFHGNKESKSIGEYQRFLKTVSLNSILSYN